MYSELQHIYTCVPCLFKEEKILFIMHVYMEKKRMKDVTQVTKNYLLHASLKLLQVGIWELPSNWVEALSIYAKKFEFCQINIK